MGKLKTHSPIYCILDNWANMLNLTHTLNEIYLTGISYVQCLQISLHNKDNEMMLYCKPKRIRLLELIINCTIIIETKPRLSRNIYAISDRIWCNKHLRHTTTENMITMGMVDTSDLKMIITWAVDISFQSPKLKWGSWTLITPYSVRKMEGNR